MDSLPDLLCPFTKTFQLYATNASLRKQKWKCDLHLPINTICVAVSLAEHQSHGMKSPPKVLYLSTKNYNYEKS